MSIGLLIHQLIGRDCICSLGRSERKIVSYLVELLETHITITTSSFLMSSSSLLRIAARAQPSTFFRANGLRSLTPRSSNALYAVPALIATSGSVSSFSTSSIRQSDKDGQEASHHEESFEEFTARYVDPQLGVESF